MLPYFKKLPFVLKDDISEQLLELSLELHDTHRDSATHLFKREHPEKINAPGKWNIDESTDTLKKIKIITDSILKCVKIPYRSYDKPHRPCILYSPAGSKLATHVDHPDENFNINSSEGHDFGRRCALSIPLNYGVEEDPTIFYNSSNIDSEVARCYYERKKLYIINTYAYHGTNVLANERYTFQISFDLDMFSANTDFDKIVKAGFPIIDLK